MKPPRVIFPSIWIFNTLICLSFLQRGFSLESLDTTESVPEEVVEDSRSAKVEAVEENSERTEPGLAVGKETSGFTDSSGNGTRATKEILVQGDSMIKNSVFKPSVHLGEIEEFKITRTNPFNDVQQVKFENIVTLKRDPEVPWTVPQSVRKNRIKFYDTDSRHSRPDPTKVQTHPVVPEVHPFLEGVFNQNPTEATLTLDKPIFPVPEFFGHPIFRTPSTENVLQDPGSVFGQGRFFGDVNHVSSGYPDFQGQFSRPPGVLDGAQHPEVLVSQEYPYPVQTVEKPYLYFATPYEAAKPIRTQKFPYKFLQTQVLPGYQDPGLPAPHPVRNKENRVSPWKKIIHVIGTFLPLGLLLAALKPRVMQIGNSTQPNIVLSKLRVIDLPAEHKEIQTEESIICEVRSICEIILAGGKSRQDLLQNVLWNLLEREQSEGPKDHSLQDVFAAIKRKDCSLIVC